MDDEERGQLVAKVATLQMLLEVNEATAVQQAARAEEALEASRGALLAREQQARLVHEIMEASNDAVLVLNEDWTIRYRNARAAALAQAGDEHVPGTVALERIYPQFADGLFRTYMRNVMSRRIAVCFEAGDDHQGCWLEVNVSPVGPGIAVFFRDVTERHTQQAALARTEKLAAVGRLASSISHEINNPLESVVNLLYLIEHAESAGDEMRMYAKLAMSELARVSHIVTQTLKFHRQAAKAQECRMSEILDSVVSLFQGRLATLHVKVSRRYIAEDSIVCLAGDMRQVFANLVGNAMDALGGAGTIWLRTRRVHCPRRGIPGLRVTVADNGAGMTEATQRRLFDAFFTTKPLTGTGLGLWVSHEIIRNHRGVVRVRSSQRPRGAGTVFALFFPFQFEGSIES